ncbi:MAG: C10 family peptidase [Prevotella sp.]|nr:C10 family peptidase [Prevotella sp.]
MKRHIIFLSFLCGLAVTSTAQPRSEREMQAIAANHFGIAAARGPQQGTALQKIAETPMVAAYALSTQQPTVFVSRDAAFAPVLGWTDSPIAADRDLPDGLQWWLNAITSTMQQKLTDNDWHTIMHAPQAHDVGPLVTSRWAQDSPYNDLCPVADSWTKRRAQTGCVATAMAQVMNYHKYPAKGQGMGYYTMSGSSVKNKKRVSGEYNWANMLDTYSSNSTVKDETTDAVATLMYDCGLASGMAYAVQGSGATSPNASSGLVYNMQYDSLAMHCHFRFFHNDEQWLQTIYDELYHKRPLLYMSTDATYGAHAFVVDGCRAADGYLHVNWGWSGEADGWFDFFNLTPQTAYQQAYGMQGYDFSKDVASQSVIFGIMPPDGTERPYESYWCLEDEETISVEGDSITLKLPTLINYHFLTFTGLVGLCIQNVATGKAPIQPFYYTAWGEDPIVPLTGWSAMTLGYGKNITDALDDGDYDLFLLSWYSSDIGKYDPQYVRYPAKNDGTENYNVWRMTKKDGHLTINKTKVPTTNGIVPHVALPTQPQTGRTYDLQGRQMGVQRSMSTTRHGQLLIKDGKKFITR